MYRGSKQPRQRDEDVFTYRLHSSTPEREEGITDYAEKKKELINDIKKIVGRESEGKSCKNVAFIGIAGVGKSSLINTIAAAFSKRHWRQFAFPGHYSNSSQVTLYTESFPKEIYCDMEEYEDYCLPTLIDIAGFEEDECVITEEILRLLFYGRIPDGTSLIELKEYAEINGVPKLRERFLSEIDGRKIDVVVFVAAAYMLDFIPSGLISNVLKAARPYSGQDTKGKRVIPVFGVLTNIDQANDSDSLFMKQEREYIEALGLDRTRYLRCENYCDEVDNKYGFDRTDNTLAKLDVPVLKFLKQVCDPVIKVLSTTENFDTAVCPDMTGSEKFNLFLKKLKQDNEKKIERLWFTESLFIANTVKFLFIFLILFLATLLTSSIDSYKLTSGCTEYAIRSKESGLDIPYFTTLCQEKSNVVFSYKYCFMYSIVITAVVVGFDVFFPEISKWIYDWVCKALAEKQVQTVKK